MIHVGLDLHRRNSMLQALTDTGQWAPRRRIQHDRIEELWQYLGQFGQEAKRVVFEATGNARWMHRLLQQDPTVEPVVVTPHKVRIIAETVAKSDRIDAAKLALLSSLDALPRAWMPDEAVEQLRELTRFRAALVRQRTQVKNQANGVLIRCGQLRPYADIFGVRGRAWLAEVVVPPVMRCQLDAWLERIDQDDARMGVVEQQLRRLATSPRWAEEVTLLRTMPGVGLLTALTILAELGDYRRFRRRSVVACFAGLVPKSRRSDGTARYGRLTKRGPAALRSILIEVCLIAIRRVPRYARLYERLKAAGKGNAGKAAVARQMLEDAWTMLIKREPFAYEPTQKPSGAGRMEPR